MKYVYEIEFCQPGVDLSTSDDSDTFYQLLEIWESRAWMNNWVTVDTPEPDRLKVMASGLQQLQDGPSTLPLPPYLQQWVDTSGCQIHIRALCTLPYAVADRAALKALVLHFTPADLLELELPPPLRDLSSFLPVPFHWIPNNQEGDLYYNLQGWFYNKEMLYKLWKADVGTHRLYVRELSDPAGAYHRKGRKLCAEVEQLSGLPTYLHIWRPPSRRSLQQELAYQLGTNHPSASQLVTDHPHYQFINHEERLVANVVPNVLPAFQEWAAVRRDC